MNPLISTNNASRFTGTTNRNGTPHPVSYAVFLCLKSATNRLWRVLVYISELSQVASAIWTNKGSRFRSVVEANTRRHSVRVGSVQSKQQDQLLMSNPATFDDILNVSERLDTVSSRLETLSTQLSALDTIAERLKRLECQQAKATLLMESAIAIRELSTGFDLAQFQQDKLQTDGAIKTLQAIQAQAAAQLAILQGEEV